MSIVEVLHAARSVLLPAKAISAVLILLFFSYLLQKSLWYFFFPPIRMISRSVWATVTITVVGRIQIFDFIKNSLVIPTNS